MASLVRTPDLSGNAVRCGAWCTRITRQNMQPYSSFRSPVCYLLQLYLGMSRLKAGLRYLMGDSLYFVRGQLIRAYGGDTGTYVTRA